MDSIGQDFRHIVRIRVRSNSVSSSDTDLDDQVFFDKVLLVGGNSVKVGAPYVEGAKVTAKVEKQGKSKKIRVFKYKAKANEHKTIGHRQPYTCLVIEAINA